MSTTVLSGLSCEVTVVADLGCFLRGRLEFTLLSQVKNHGREASSTLRTLGLRDGDLRLVSESFPSLEWLVLHGYLICLFFKNDPCTAALLWRWPHPCQLSL